ncbi:MAG: hypothetical protein A2W91_14230 [Bacteroidetes bacterium GWF2_38_335]|nr:MAG: hypothetical protein A2W91_14230 [Bacteroidetes bacterium GWF2_38_335]OFY79379.1 MAG: hypothetical protein A2281_16925 [Bacteroidetes bacterium RIFOXYA12_FULL_38_20]HBS85643.1 hypothetical protein [Bacteroidales bacterium]
MAKRALQEINAGSMADIAFLLLIFFLVTTTMDKDAGLMRVLPPPPDKTLPDQQMDRRQRDIFIVLINKDNKMLVEGKIMPVYQVGEGSSRKLVDAAKNELGEMVYVYAGTNSIVSNNDLMRITPNEDLRDQVKEFILNPMDKSNLPEFRTVNTSLCNEKITEATAAIQANTPATTTELADALEKASKEKEKWEKKLNAIKTLETYGSGQRSYREAPMLVISLQNDKGTSYAAYIAVQNELTRAYREIREEYCKKVFGKPFAELDTETEEDKIDAIETIIPIKISEAEPKEIK